MISRSPSGRRRPPVDRWPARPKQGMPGTSSAQTLVPRAVRRGARPKRRRASRSRSSLPAFPAFLTRFAPRSTSSLIGMAAQMPPCAPFALTTGPRGKPRCPQRTRPTRLRVFSPERRSAANLSESPSPRTAAVTRTMLRSALLCYCRDTVFHRASAPSSNDRWAAIASISAHDRQSQIPNVVASSWSGGTVLSGSLDGALAGDPHVSLLLRPAAIG